MEIFIFRFRLHFLFALLLLYLTPPSTSSLCTRDTTTTRPLWRVHETRGGYSRMAGVDDDDDDDEDEFNDEGDGGDGEAGNNSGSAHAKSLGAKSDTSDSGSAKVQFMVTGRMRQVLTEELNYLPNEVDMIEPQIAAVVIERGLARPSAGMPASWRKTNVARAVNKRWRRKGGGSRLSVPGLNLVGRLLEVLSDRVGTILENRKLLLLPVIAGAAFVVAPTESLRNIGSFKLSSLTKKLKVPKLTKRASAPRKVNVNEIIQKIDSKQSTDKKKTPININSVEALQGKSYNTWLEKLR